MHEQHSGACYWSSYVRTLAMFLVSPGDAASSISFLSGIRMPVFAPGALGTFATSVIAFGLEVL